MAKASITIQVDPAVMRQIKEASEMVADLVETQRRMIEETLDLFCVPSALFETNPFVLSRAKEAMEIARRANKRILIEGLGAKMCPNCESALPVDQAMCGCGWIFEE